MGIELGRVFVLQLLKSLWFEEDRYSIISSAEFTDLVDDFGGDSHVPIVLVIFCCEEWPAFCLVSWYSTEGRCEIEADAHLGDGERERRMGTG